MSILGEVGARFGEHGGWALSALGSRRLQGVGQGGGPQGIGPGRPSKVTVERDVT